MWFCDGAYHAGFARTHNHREDRRQVQVYHEPHTEQNCARSRTCGVTPHQKHKVPPCFVDRRPPTRETLTYKNNHAHKKCQKWMHRECISHLCPTYCEARYPKGKGKYRHHFGGQTIDPLLNECLLSCKKTKCNMPIDLNAFDEPLRQQMERQMTACIHETRGQSDECGELNERDQKWRKSRAPLFKKMEKYVTGVLKEAHLNKEIEGALKDF